MMLQLGIKRVMDVLFALLALVVLSGVLLSISLAIKLDSKGPVLFKQERLGKNGKAFHIYKFRTMIVGAETKGRGIFQDENDDRITKVGKLLRMTSLDELPQLFNILKGEMSFIGPRPPLTYYPYPADEYTDEQKVRFQFLPGMTGYAQVMGRNSLSWEEKIHYDVDYVDNYSLGLDMKIFILTIYKIMQREHVHHPEAAETPLNKKA
ncbi:sugar transferase [Domibacillus enclensis]|uniref:Sugar transferase involved in LPS biosynthesis (Colanic, teichoic acid) n=2 Tax=Domibacillus enclensis TaxID=1017273 RepID=A0A1N6RYN0_9BACI|nr:sugar transferase [Domibacillus enclensis]SIQ33842.1 Sugar transferase involved in LPS biosynthesis (colanic, teichoic acid) [Domibacillus enclensis]